MSRLEQCESFSICFVRKGYYEQHVFRKRQEMHLGRVLVTKPGIEYQVRHIDNHPDLCTSFAFTLAFYERLHDHYGAQAAWFFQNPDLQSILLATPPTVEFLHAQILGRARHGLSLEIDELILRLVDQVMGTLLHTSTPAPVPERLKRHHLVTAEKAKDYLFRHFDRNLSLQELADHCCVSLFHFGRIFKALLNKSPHQYLIELRLQHAHLQLKSTDMPVTEIAFQCGFNSLEHFVTSYRKQFHESPSDHRVKETRLESTLLTHRV